MQSTASAECIVGNGTQRQPSQASWKEALQDIRQTLFLTYLSQAAIHNLAFLAYCINCRIIFLQVFTMQYKITLEPLLTEANDIPNIIENDGTASIHIKTRELINRIPPYANWYVQQIVGYYVFDKLRYDGFSIFDEWYSQAANYPGEDQSYNEYVECGYMVYQTEEDSVLNLANINSSGGLSFEVSTSFNPFKLAV